MMQQHSAPVSESAGSLPRYRARGNRGRGRGRGTKVAPRTNAPDVPQAPTPSPVLIMEQKPSVIRSPHDISVTGYLGKYTTQVEFDVDFKQGIRLAETLFKAADSIGRTPLSQPFSNSEKYSPRHMAALQHLANAKALAVHAHQHHKISDEFINAVVEFEGEVPSPVHIYANELGQFVRENTEHVIKDAADKVAHHLTMFLVKCSDLDDEAVKTWESAPQKIRYNRDTKSILFTPGEEDEQSTLMQFKAKTRTTLCSLITPVVDTHGVRRRLALAQVAEPNNETIRAYVTRHISGTPFQDQIERIVTEMRDFYGLVGTPIPKQVGLKHTGSTYVHTFLSAIGKARQKLSVNFGNRIKNVLTVLDMKTIDGEGSASQLVRNFIDVEGTHDYRTPYQLTSSETAHGILFQYSGQIDAADRYQWLSSESIEDATQRWLVNFIPVLKYPP
jgi:hypothetical protein